MARGEGDGQEAGIRPSTIRTQSLQKQPEKSERYNDALRQATILHQGQTRKGSDVAYITHPIAVAELVAANGGSEDAQIAALYHDVLEDVGAHGRDIIRAHGGERVLAIVEQCTETDVEPKPPWKGRKLLALDHIHHADEDARLVMLCDKTSNAEDTLRDLQEQGQAVWDMFNAPYEDQKWWYESLSAEFARAPSPLQERFAEIVRKLFA